MEKLSYSSLSQYETCPLQFKFKYIDKTYIETDSIFLKIGKAAHNAIAKYIKGTHIDKAIKDSSVEEGISEYKIKEMVYYATRLISFEKDYFIEKFIECDFEGTRILGFVDLRFDNIIVDWKTGSECTRNQIDLYAMIFKRNGINIDFAYYCYMKLKKYVKFDITNESINQIEEWTRNIIYNINLGKFEPKQNEYCKYCSHKKKLYLK